AEMTVRRFLAYWLDEVLPLSNVTPTTRMSYGYVVRLYINPHIGGVQLDKLSPAHVRMMLKKLVDEGKSRNTQRQARSILGRALRTAEIDGLVTRNVAHLVDGVPLDDVKEGRTLTVEQAQKLLQHVRGHELEAIVTLMLTTGLRRGELAGL